MVNAALEEPRLCEWVNRSVVVKGYPWIDAESPSALMERARAGMVIASFGRFDLVRQCSSEIHYFEKGELGWREGDRENPRLAA
jgi:hypothetical protein